MSAGPADEARRDDHRRQARPGRRGDAPTHQRSERQGRGPEHRVLQDSPQDAPRVVGASRLSDDERAQITRTLLLRAAATGDETERRACLDAVVEVNMRVAEAVARRYSNRGVALEDLRQVAYLALVRAVRTFEPSREVDLLSFAVPSMTGEIRRHFRDHSWTIRPPRRVQETCTRLVRAGGERDRLDDAGLATLAAQVDAEVDTVREALTARHLFTPPSLDRVVGEQVREPASDDDGLERAETRALLDRVLRQVSLTERRVLDLRFGQQLSQQAIADRLGMTQVQVSRTLQRVLLQLRSAIGDVAAA
ncbi:sigma-70 family RNA polymerase sigma factor [Nocardioides sp. GY 10127]|uniref:sigma-70 family RNA polymerase sigma factor n=1 Tax=Nocardioides sp. GY 10127 TaxID=2569762 RepID=UPI0014583C91|nr:sigma-70 family RNA polymerase sigma factor [Nocardioides sp. GY 10127]